jgi:hypothetical protein
MLWVALSTAPAGASAIPTLDGRGCCSNHHGQCGCQGNQVVCCDKLAQSDVHVLTESCWCAHIRTIARYGQRQEEAMGDFAATIQAVYAQHPAGCSLQHAPIEPFMGRAFRESRTDDLRVLAIGVTAYVDDHEWSSRLPSPKAFSGWFEKEMRRFQACVARDVATIGEEFRRRAPYFSGLSWQGKDSVYVTNFVKSFVRTSVGKREGQLADRDIAAYASTWRAELKAMAAHDVLPHVVIVYSRRIWDHVWPAFREPRAGGSLEVTEYRALLEEPQHRVNRLLVAGGGGKQNLLLLRLRHPSSPDKTANPEWLLSHASVRAFLELQPRPGCQPR